MNAYCRLLVGLSLAAVPATAQASEIFGGIYAHDVDSPLTLSGIEGGLDVQLGWRGNRIGRTPIQPYALVSAHTEGETHFAALGISARFGDRLFIRPGLGLAVHTGSADNFNRTDRIAFGSRVLFAPELGIGAQITDQVSVEASIVHLSHGTLFGRQNPGMDSVGVRLNFDLP